MLGTVEQPLAIILWGVIFIFIIRVIVAAVYFCWEAWREHKKDKELSRINDIIRGVRH